jgi:hypothetical protein
MNNVSLSSVVRCGAGAGIGVGLGRGVEVVGLEAIRRQPRGMRWHIMLSASSSVHIRSPSDLPPISHRSPSRSSFRLIPHVPVHLRSLASLHPILTPSCPVLCKGCAWIRSSRGWRQSRHHQSQPGHSTESPRRDQAAPDHSRRADGVHRAATLFRRCPEGHWVACVRCNHSVRLLRFWRVLGRIGRGSPLVLNGAGTGIGLG